MDPVVTHAGSSSAGYATLAPSQRTVTMHDDDPGGVTGRSHGTRWSVS
jgi:hypothetical protein